jgi:Lipopolysaccharide-assembly
MRAAHHAGQTCGIPYFPVAWGFALMLLTSGGCKWCYTGAPTLHRQDIRSVYVPIFESESWRRFPGQRLTESVIKQIERDTPFCVAGPEAADSVLTARIVDDTKIARGQTANDDPRILEAALVVEVDWTDRNGNPLAQRQKIRIRRGEDFIPEGGQSLTVAQQQVIDRLARDIVNQMETPW